MAYQVYRLRQKTDAGGYDILHVESRTDLVLRFDAEGILLGTLEDNLADIEQSIATLTSDQIPKVASAVDGNFPVLTAEGVLVDSGIHKDKFTYISFAEAEPTDQEVNDLWFENISGETTETEGGQDESTDPGTDEGGNTDTGGTEDESTGTT